MMNHSEVLPDDPNVDVILITPCRPSLLKAPALMLVPSLVSTMSIPKALLLQQVYYWTRKTKIRNAAGEPVICYSYADWQRQLPFLSTRWIKQLLDALAAGGWIFIEPGTSKRRYRMNQTPSDEFPEFYVGNIFSCPADAIKVFPSLVLATGMVEAIMLQTIHIRTYKKHDWWVRKSAKDWHQDLLPFVGLRSIERALSRLKERELVTMKKGTEVGRPASTVRVNYSNLAGLLSADIRSDPPRVPIRSAKNAAYGAKSSSTPATSSTSSASSSSFS